MRSTLAPKQPRETGPSADAAYPWPHTAVEYIVASQRQPKARYDWMIQHLAPPLRAESGRRAALVRTFEGRVRKCRQRGLLTKHPQIEPTPRLWRILVKGDMEDLLRKLADVGLEPPIEPSPSSEYPWPQTAVEYIVASRRRPRAKYEWMTEHLAAPDAPVKGGREVALARTFEGRVRECRQRGLLTKHPRIEPTWRLWRILVQGEMEDLLAKLAEIGLEPPTEVHFRLGLTIHRADEPVPAAPPPRQMEPEVPVVRRFDAGDRAGGLVAPVQRGVTTTTTAVPTVGRPARPRPVLRLSLVGPGLIAIGALAIAVAWLVAYPIVPKSLASWRDFPSVYWVGVATALLGASTMTFALDARRQVLAVVAVALVSVSPQLFFLAAGQDTVGLLPLYRRIDALEHLSFASRRALEVPGVSLWARAIGDLAGLEPVAVLKIGLIVFAVVFVLGTLWLARAYHVPAAAAATILPIVAAFPFLNWQFANQSLALAMMLVVLALLSGTPGPSRLVSVYAISAFLVVSHQFVAIWLIGVLLVRYLIERRSAARDGGGALGRAGSVALRVAITVAIFQVTYLVFISSFELTGFYRALSGTASVYRQDTELTSRQFGEYSTGGLSLDADPLLRATKLLAFVAMACAAGAMLAGALRKPKWRTSGVVHIGLVITGVLHIVIGAAVNVLGARGLNLITVGAGYGARGLERDVRLGRITRFAACLAVVLFSFLVFRTQVENPNVLTPGTDSFLGRVASHLAAGRPVDLTGETIYALQIPWRVGFAQYETYNNVVAWQGQRTIRTSTNLCAFELAAFPVPKVEASLDLVADQGGLRLYCQPRNPSKARP